VIIRPIQEKPQIAQITQKKNPPIDTDFHRLEEETTEGSENTEVSLRLSASLCASALTPLRLCSLCVSAPSASLPP